MKYKRGQAVMEMVMFLPLAFGGLVVCLFVFYTCSKQLWVDHQLYQFLICLSQRVNQLKCQRKLKKGIRSFLWMGDKIKTLKFNGKENKWSGYLVIENIYIRGVWKKKVHFNGDL